MPNKYKRNSISEASNFCFLRVNKKHRKVDESHTGYRASSPN